MWHNGTIAITNSNDDSAFSWKISLWIITSPNLFPLAVSSTLQFSLIFSINFMTSPNVLYIFKQSIIHFVRLYIMIFFRHITTELDFLVSSLREDVVINVY